jgi:hypothetical protein
VPDPQTPPPAAAYITIGEAADILGAKPWDVVRLIEEARLEAVQLVDVASLRKFKGAA